jgi:hypothetical protein
MQGCVTVVVARGGIEPATPAFSGLRSNIAKESKEDADAPSLIAGRPWESGIKVAICSLCSGEKVRQLRYSDGTRISFLPFAGCAKFALTTLAQLLRTTLNYVPIPRIIIDLQGYPKTHNQLVPGSIPGGPTTRINPGSASQRL